MNEFIINDNGVCINPIKETVFSDKNFQIEVKYANIPNSWSFGLEIEYNHPKVGLGGIGSPCSFSGEVYKTKEDCQKAAFNSIMWHIKNWNSPKVLDAVKCHFLTPQLSLF